MRQLRRVLLRHVQRHAPQAEPGSTETRINELLARYEASRLLDDDRFAQNLVRGLRARGASTMRIRQKLRQRGVEDETIERTLSDLADAGEATDNPDLTAARAYVRRRKLTTRYDLDDPAQRQKALAALARQGFAFSVAKAALTVDDDEEDSLSW